MGGGVEVGVSEWTLHLKEWVHKSPSLKYEYNDDLSRIPLRVSLLGFSCGMELFINLQDEKKYGE
jgi:hypothetical protein